MLRPDREKLIKGIFRVAAFVQTQRDVKDDQTQRTCMDEWTRVIRGEISTTACIKNMKHIIAESRETASAPSQP